MLKSYTIEVHAYPQEFIICANSEDEAKQKARERFTEATGQSVYETIVTDTQNIADVKEGEDLEKLEELN